MKSTSIHGESEMSNYCAIPMFWQLYDLIDLLSSDKESMCYSYVLTLVWLVRFALFKGTVNGEWDDDSSSCFRWWASINRTTSTCYYAGGRVPEMNELGQRGCHMGNMWSSPHHMPVTIITDPHHLNISQSLSYSTRN